MQTVRTILRRALPLIGGMLLVVTVPASAQQCVGDCNDNHRVDIDELVRGVGISIGDIGIEQCPAFDVNSDGRVAINELTRAVVNSLDGCHVTPPTLTPTSVETATPTTTDAPTPSLTATRSLTRTPSNTATPSETKTPTPTVIPDVSGIWREDQLSLTSSDCPQQIVDQIGQKIASQPSQCDYQLLQVGSGITGVALPSPVPQCKAENTATGEVDGLGTVRIDFDPVSGTDQGCTVTLIVTLTIGASHSPTTAQYLFQTSFSGVCGVLPPCTTTVEGRWTRLS